MKRYMFRGVFALAAIAAALTACPATAQDLPFNATLTGSPYPVVRTGSTTSSLPRGRARMWAPARS